MLSSLNLGVKTQQHFVSSSNMFFDKKNYFLEIWHLITTHPRRRSYGRDFHYTITVKPLLSGHIRDLPKCPVYRVCPLKRGFKNYAMFVNN